MRQYGALAVVLAALMVATSVGLETTVFEMEAEELPSQVDGMIVNSLRQQVREAVIEAVSVRRAKRELKQKEAANAETRAAEALKQAKAERKKEADPKQAKKMVKQAEAKSEAIAEKMEKAKDKAAAKDEVKKMIAKAVEGNNAADELVKATEPGALEKKDTKEEQKATLAAFKPVLMPTKVMAASGKVLDLTKAADKHIAMEVKQATEYATKHISSKFERGAVMAAMQKEMAPAIRKAAEKLGADVATGKMNPEVRPGETAAEAKEVANESAKAAKDAKKAESLIEAADKQPKGSPVRKALDKAAAKAQEKEAVAKETAKMVKDQPDGEKKVNTEEEDQMSIAMTKAKLNVINSKVETQVLKANERINKGKLAKKWAAKELRKSQELANKQKKTTIEDAKHKARLIARRARATARDARRKKRQMRVEAREMKDEAELMAQDAGLPKIPHGQPGYGILRRSGRENAIAAAKAAKTAAKMKVAAERAEKASRTIDDRSVHVSMERNEPPNGGR